MSVGFGFSIGDLVAGLKVIKDSVEAVKDTKGASADYAALVSEVASLQDGLEAIDELQLSSRGAPWKQRLAIERAIEACQKCVEDFMNSVSKYQPHLQSHATGMVSAWRKIRWALCKKEDVALFRTRLERHSSSINMLLLSLQAHGQVSVHHWVSDGSDLGLTAPDRSRDRRTLDLLHNLSVEQRRCFEMMMHQNRELMRNVQDLHRLLQMQMTIPPQVLLQQPVILLDASGKVAPFHLEFIDCLETFTAVLKIRFRKAGVKQPGLSKLDNREYTIQETRAKRLINVEKPWPKVFRPGQEVDMSMVFHRIACPPSMCPGCSRKNENADEQIECQGCGLCYQNIKPSSAAAPVARIQSTPIGRPMNKRPGMNSESAELPDVISSEDPFFDGYRRVQVISLTDIPIPTADPDSPHPLEAFPAFVDLFIDVEKNQLPSLIEMRRIKSRVKDHSQRSEYNPPLPLAMMKQWHIQIAEERSLLQHDISNLFSTIHTNEQNTALLKYILQNHPKERESTTKNPYTNLLLTPLTKKEKKKNHHPDAFTLTSALDLINDDDETKEPLMRHGSLTKGKLTGKVKFNDQIQWMLLNSRGN